MHKTLMAAAGLIMLLILIVFAAFFAFDKPNEDNSIYLRYAAVDLQKAHERWNADRLSPREKADAANIIVMGNAVSSKRIPTLSSVINNLGCPDYVQMIGYTLDETLAISQEFPRQSFLYFDKGVSIYFSVTGKIHSMAYSIYPEKHRININYHEDRHIQEYFSVLETNKAANQKDNKIADAKLNNEISAYYREILTEHRWTDFLHSHAFPPYELPESYAVVCADYFDELPLAYIVVLFEGQQPVYDDQWWYKLEDTWVIVRTADVPEILTKYMNSITAVSERL